MASMSEREKREIEAANASGNTPVVLIHGLWLLPSSWAAWVDFFTEAGYAPLTPDWPDDPGTVAEARANPDVFAKKTLGQIADHTTEVVKALDRRPALVGHSTGGLLAQVLAGRGLSAATVAIDPGVFRGVLPLPVSTLRTAGPFLVDPRTRGRAITLTFDQFRYGWANALDEAEARELYDTFHVAGSGLSLMQMGNANLNPWTEAKVDTANPARGAVGDRERRLRAAAAQPRRDGDRGDPGPGPLPHDRPRLARCRPDGARLRPAVHVSGHCAGCIVPSARYRVCQLSASASRCGVCRPGESRSARS
jgi:non-heme chloroperoxidase